LGDYWRAFKLYDIGFVGCSCDLSAYVSVG